MRAAMDRHERFRYELAAGFEAEKKMANLGWRLALECLEWRRDVILVKYDHRHRELHRAIKELEESIFSCRSREAAAIARGSLLRELASAGNSSGLDVAPSYSRGRDETPRTEPDAPLEPAQPDFAPRASKETNKFEPTLTNKFEPTLTNKFEPTFGLQGEMDEFRRLKVMYPAASTRILAEFQIFAKGVAARREDGRGSGHRGEDNREDTGEDRRRGRHSSRKDFMDPPRRRPGGRPSAGPRWDETIDSSCTSSDLSRGDRRRRSHRRTKEKHQDHSAISASPSRSPALEQLPAPPLLRPQHLVPPTVHHPAPSEPASEKSSTLLSEISSRPSQREDVSRQCYTLPGTKSPMKLPTVLFKTAEGNSQMNFVNFTASLKKTVAPIRDLGGDFSEDDFRIPGRH